MVTKPKYDTSVKIQIKYNKIEKYIIQMIKSDKKRVDINRGRVLIELLMTEQINKDLHRTQSHFFSDKYI